MSPIFLSFLQLYIYVPWRGRGEARARGFFFKEGRRVDESKRKEIIELIADKLPVAKHSNRR